MKRLSFNSLNNIFRRMINSLIGIPGPVYLCYTFSGEVNTGSEYTAFYRSAEHDDTSQEFIERLTLETLGLDNVGMIVLNLYGCKIYEGVTNYIEGFRSLPDRLLLHNLNHHAVLIKTFE